MGREGARTGKGLEVRISRSPSGGPESRGGVSRGPAFTVGRLTFALGLLALAACGIDRRGKDTTTGTIRSAALVEAFRSLDNFQPLPLPEEITDPDTVFISATSVTPEGKIRWIRTDLSSIIETEWNSSILEADAAVDADGTISYPGPVATIDTRTLEQGLHLAAVRSSLGDEVCETDLPSVIEDGASVIEVSAYLGLSDTDGSDIIFGAARMGRVRGGSTTDSGDIVAIPSDSSSFPINDWTEFRSTARIIPSLNPEPEDPNEAFQSNSAVIDDISRDAYISGRCRRFLGNCLIPGDDNADIKFIPYDDGIGDWDLSRMEEIASTDDSGEGPIGILNTTVTDDTATRAKCLIIGQSDGLAGSGGSNTYYHCDLTTVAPDPDAGTTPPDLGPDSGPAVIEYDCTDAHACVEATGIGEYPSAEACLAACIPPPPRYDCNAASECVSATPGTYASFGDCEAACVPPPAGYECNISTYLCEEVPGGTYSDVITCEVDCEPPPDPRYSCNDGTGICYENEVGPFGELPECEAACEAPARYACNEGTGACTENEGGVYSSMEGCEAVCNLPDPRYSCDIEAGVCSVDSDGTYSSLPACEAECDVPPVPEDAGSDGPKDMGMPDEGEPEREDGPGEKPDQTEVHPPRDGGPEEQRDSESDREDEGSQTEMPVTDQPPGCGACAVSKKPAEKSNAKGLLALAALAGALFSRKRRR